MRYTFSAEELFALEATAQALVSPLAAPSVEKWQALVNERATQLFEADSASFFLVRPGAAVAWQMQNMDNQFKSDYFDNYQYLDASIRDPVYRNTWSEISNTTEASLGDFSLYQASVAYNEFYRRYQIEDCVGAFVWARPEAAHGASATSLRSESFESLATTAFTVYRARSGTELFGDKGLVLMHLLRPALRAGIEMACMAAAYQANLAHSLDMMRAGAWLCSPTGTVLHQNKAMTQLLSADPERERLKTALSAAVRMPTTLHGAQRRKSREEPLLPALPTVRTSQGTYLMRGSLLEANGHENMPGLVVMLEKTAEGLPSLEALHEQWGLTKQEARVALLLAQRKRNSEIAAELSISPSTARRHTENVLSKLGIHSRNDVAGIILGHPG